MSSNGTQSELLSGFHIVGDLTWLTTSKYILLSFDVLVMVLNFLVNFVVFISLLMAKFLRDASLIFLWIEFAQNLSSDLVEWSCAVVIITTPRRHMFFICVADICITLISQTPCAFASSVIWPNMYPWHDCSILWGFSYPCFWLRNSMHCIWCIYMHVFSQET